jgi:DNA gyrase subunit B
VQRRAEVEVAFRWGTGYERTVECFTNTIRNAHGGTHRKGFERALARTLADAVRSTRGLLKAKEDAPTLDDVLEGMTAVVHVRIPEPQFTSQTKDELSTAGITRVLQSLVEQHLKAWLEDRRTKAEARTVLQKIVDAARVRLTQKQQKDAARRKTALEGASMPAKLVDCRAAGIERSELFIVEGDSALGTGRLARSSEYQALLPIRGKILNVQKANLQQVLDNAECAAIVQVLGAGSGRTFDLSAMRYGRVLIMADADVDGAHIRTLLITLFARYMRPLIEAGRLYAAMPPLHKITTRGRNPQ